MSFSVNRNLGWGLVALGGLMLAALLADFLSPYDPIAQHRESAFAPPARLRFVDAEGRRHWRPFVYAPQTRERIYPLRLMVRGAPYRLLGVISCERHLFGVEFRCGGLGPPRSIWPTLPPDASMVFGK